MKIIVLAGFAESLINFRKQMLVAMARQGHEVIALAPGLHPDVEDSLKAIGVKYIPIEMQRTGFNPLSDVSMCVKLAALFRMLKPDILLSYTIKPVIFGSIAARLSGVKKTYSMITGLGYAFAKDTFARRVINGIVLFLYKIALSENQYVFFQNPDDMALFKSLYLIRENQAKLINGSGVDLKYYYVSSLPDCKPSFLLMARLIKAKGIIEYVEAAKHLKGRYPTIIFRLLGPFDSNPDAVQSEYIANAVKDGIIEYHGSVSDVRPFLAKTSVYVLPSYYREGIPHSVLEAMAMGRPIITTNAPGCRETVIEGQNGFLVPPKDVAALSRTMEQFILEPELVAKMGRESRRIAEGKYDVHKVNSVILSAMGLIDEKTV